MALVTLLARPALYGNRERLQAKRRVGGTLALKLDDVGVQHPHWIFQAKEHVQIGGKTNGMHCRTSQPHYNAQIKCRANEM